MKKIPSLFRKPRLQGLFSLKPVQFKFSKRSSSENSFQNHIADASIFNQIFKKVINCEKKYTAIVGDHEVFYYSPSRESTLVDASVSL